MWSKKKRKMDALVSKNLSNLKKQKEKLESKLSGLKVNLNGRSRFVSDVFSEKEFAKKSKQESQN